MGDFRSLLTPLILLALIVAVGTVGYQIIENLGPVEALYMTLITMSTVGFGEVGHSFSAVGRLFTMGLIVTSVTVGAYCIGIVVAWFVEGRMLEAIRRKRMSNRIEKLSGHTILCGVGRSGASALQKFKGRRKAIVAIEMDEELVNETLEDHPDLLIFQGNCTVEEVLLEAGVARAHSIIFAVSDTDAIIGTLTARSLNPDIRIVCRAGSEETARKLKHAGADHIIQPEAIAGTRMAIFVSSPAVVEFLEGAMQKEGVELRMEEMRVPEGGSIVGVPIDKTGIREKSGGSVIGLKRAGETVVNPSFETRIEAGDVLIVLGEATRLQQYREANFLL